MENTVYNGNINKIKVENIGTMWELALWRHNEDGKELVFIGIYDTEDEAYIVLAAWRNPDMHGLVFAATRLQPHYDDNF